jgi:hypothetical protein
MLIDPVAMPQLGEEPQSSLYITNSPDKRMVMFEKEPLRTDISIQTTLGLKDLPFSALCCIADFSI